MKKMQAIWQFGKSNVHKPLYQQLSTIPVNQNFPVPVENRIPQV